MKQRHLLFLLFVTGLGFSFLFELKWYYLFLVLSIYFIFLKKIAAYQQKQVEEEEKFQQINSYMCQISQRFVRSKNILSALEETRSTFPSGHLQTLLDEAIDILLLEGGNITDAQRKALLRIESEYPCEKLRTLHEFMLLAEQQGGNCKREFVLLEKMRIAWENALQKYHYALLEARNLSTILYGLMLAVCVFVLHAFPKELSIVQIEFIQITNTVLTSLLILFFCILDRQICGQFFRNPKILNTTKESAILHSVNSAPPILQPELAHLSEQIISFPGDISIFSSFLEEYHLPQVERNMRKLYALSIGAEEKEESVNFLIESNMDSLMLAEEKSYETKGGLSSLFHFLPLLVVSIGMLIYCVAIILVSLSHITSLFQ